MPFLLVAIDNTLRPCMTSSASATHEVAQDEGRQDSMPSAADGLSSAPAGDGDQVPDALAAREEELTREVQSLLESMNSKSSEVNAFERQMAEAQSKYKALLEQWSRLYEELRAQHGSAIDRVRPYFDAQQSLRAASHRVQDVIKEFSVAASQHSVAKRELRSIEEGLAYGAHKVQLDGDQQDGLSKATVWVLKCQQERDRREREYVRALKEFQEAQEALESWRAQIGDSMINRTLPCFKQLQHNQITLHNEQQRINTFAERARQAKNGYQTAIRELERVSLAVHSERERYAKMMEAKASPEECPEDTHPVAGEDAAFNDCCACGARGECGACSVCSTFGTSPRTVERNMLIMAAAAGLGGAKATASADDGPFA